MNNRNKRVGIITSVALHAIIVIVFLLMKYELIPENIKPIEIMQFGYQEVANNSQKISPIIPPSKQNNNFKTGKKSNSIPQKVKLPEALSNNEEEIFVPQSTETALNNLDMNDDIGNSFEQVKSNLSKLIPSKNETFMEDIVVPSSEDYLNSLTKRLAEGNGVEAPYILEGDISRRTVLNKVLPTYPAGVQKSVSVKIRLEVNPDGSVGNMIITKKAGSPFDNSALSALKQWKFNAISRDVKQVGTITFMYELR